jgi:hypothetical protein
VARNGIVAALALAVALVGCGGEEPAEGPDIAALRAKNDSIRAARAAAAPAPATDSAGAAPAAMRHDTAGAGTATDSAATDSAATDSAPIESGDARPGETAVLRETFVYTGGTRDPFASLLTLKSTGPELVDLQLVGVYQNLEAPSQSVAVVREKDGGKRWKLRVGDRIGRMRVAAIRQKDLVFAISDFGYERQETLSLRKPLEEDEAP